MNIKLHKKSCDIFSSCSTQEDNSDERDEEDIFFKTNSLKHKTQLCKNFTENGWCPYYNKCRFAHGTYELISAPISNRCFRKKKCNNFTQKGYCSYGTRCQFGHEQTNWQDHACIIAIQAILGQTRLDNSSKFISSLKQN